MRHVRFAAALLAVGCVLLAATSARAGDGELFVVNENPLGAGTGYIGAYDAATGGTINSSLVPGLTTPHAIAVSGNSLLVSDWGTSSIDQYNSSTGATITAPLISGATGVGGMTVSGGDLWATTLSGGQSTAEPIDEYSTSGTPVSVPLLTLPKGSVPFGVAEANNILYVALEETLSAGAGKIVEYNATTGALVNSSFVTGLNQPEGIWLSGNNLYVANNADFNGALGPLTNGTIGEYDATTGNAINASLVSGLNQPAYVAVLGNNLYVSTYSNNVGEYNATTGATINANFVTGLNDPQGLFVIATPEPSTLVMLAIGGLGLLAIGLHKSST